MLATFLMSAFAADPWIGTYTLDDYQLRFHQDGSKRRVELVMAGEVVALGPLIGDGTLRTAPLDSCGGTFSIEAGDMQLEVDGPECPYEMNGLYQRARPTPCGSAPVVLACTVDQKGKRKQLAVCEPKKGQFAYRYGTPGSPELSLEGGKHEERALVSGLDLGWRFENEGYTYRAFVVQSARAADNGAGIVVSKDGKDLATLSCEEGWTYTP